jgi:hypothetical protein
MVYQPLDIFFTRNPTFLSRVIRWAEREPGEAKSEASHVGAIVSNGPLKKVYCIEALKKVRYHSLWSRYRGRGTMTVYRPKNIEPDDVEEILWGLRRHVGDSYGYLKIGLHFLRKLTGNRNWLKLSVLDRYPICSYLVATEFEAQGYDFGVKGRLATPDDMLDFCQANPDKWQCVRPWAEV